MKLLFLHGWQSTPGGVKPTYLKNHGHKVLNPSLPDDDFDGAVRVAQAEFDRHRPDVVVGSSRGGAVAMNIDSGNTPLVLLCPAWKLWGTATAVKPGTVILHSPADDVVPFEDSLELVRNSGLPASALVEVGTEHRLADEESLKKMLEVVDKAAKSVRLGGRHLATIALGMVAAFVVMFFIVFAMFSPSWEGAWLFAIAAIFFTSLAIGQQLLYKGLRPFKSSAVIGATFFVSLWVFYQGASLFFHSATGTVRPWYAFPFAPFDPIEAGVFGALWGLVLGTPVACVLYSIKKVASYWTKRQMAREAAQ